MALSIDEKKRQLTGQQVQQPQKAAASPSPAQQQAYKPGAAAGVTSQQSAPAAVQGQGGGAVQRPAQFQYQNQAQLDALYDQIVNRPAFQFDLANNPMWQSYKEQYTRLGQMAMQDTMGQAAGLTGGYGSSYGQAVGQQAYNRYLQELNGIVPELYAQERAAYDADTQRMMQLYGLEADRESQAYNRYNDSYNQWWQESQAAQDQANWQASFDFNQSQDAWKREQADLDRADAAAKFEWQKAMDERDYNFSREQWEWQKAQAEAAAARSGGGYRYYGSGEEETEEEVNEEPEKNNTNIYRDAGFLAAAYMNEINHGNGKNVGDIDSWMRANGASPELAEMVKRMLRRNGYKV